MTRILLCTPALPYPTRSGPDLRVSGLAAALGTLGPLALVGVIRRADEVPAPPAIELACSADDPELQARWAATGPANALGDSPSAPYYSPGAEASLYSVLTDFRPDVVVLDHVYLADYLPALRSSTAAHIVLNTHNIETDLQRQLAQSESHPAARLLRKRFAAQVEALERRVVAAVDAVWVCSDADRERVQTLFEPAVPVHVVPNTVDVGAYACVWQGEVRAPADLADGAPTIIFTGQFSYPPNAAAASTLIHQVLPAVRAYVPEVRLLLAGRAPTAEMLSAAAADPGVVVTGAFEQVAPYLAAATVMAVPLVSGGGTRLKLLEAFAAGVPVVTTAIGADGLEVIDGTHLLLGESAAECAAQVARLLRETSLRASLAEEAHRLVVTRYSVDAGRAAVERALAVVRPGGARP